MSAITKHAAVSPSTAAQVGREFLAFNRRGVLIGTYPTQAQACAAIERRARAS